MLVYYNIYPSQKSWKCSQHIATFYFGKCTPEEMLDAVQQIRKQLDSSVGTIFFHDWDWKSDQGNMRIESTHGVTEETLKEVCDNILETIKRIGL